MLSFLEARFHLWSVIYTLPAGYEFRVLLTVAGVMKSYNRYFLNFRNINRIVKKGITPKVHKGILV
jgi:hypothetical protein